MKRLTWTLGFLVVAGVATAVAQPPGGPGRRGGPPGGAGGPGGGRPSIPVIDVLDADRDHEISADELKNATASLLTLDKNKDGKLTENEFGPQDGGPGGRGAGGAGNGRNGRGAGQRNNQPGGQGGRGAGGPGGGGPGGGGPGGGGPERGGPGDGPDGPRSPERMVEHAMEFDADNDGKLSKNELMKFAEELHRHPPGPGGPPGGGPDGREADGGDDDRRPHRPKRPD